MIASVQELITQERSAGSTDDQIARLLRASNIHPPERHYRWTKIAVRAEMTEDASGYLPDGRYGGAQR